MPLGRGCRERVWGSTECWSSTAVAWAQAPGLRVIIFVRRRPRRRKLSAVLLTQADTHSATQSFAMIRLGNQLRLTGREVERFTRITGIEPVGVKSLDDLDDYIGRCKDYYQGASQEARFLRWLLDEERSRCLCAA